MDGVLIDAKEWHYEALNKALDLFGFAIPREAHLAVYDGLPTRDKLRILSEDNKLPVSLHRFINDLKQQYTMEMVATECSPRFNHEYTLSRLTREGYKLAVASNSIRNTVSTMMKRSHLDGYLEFFISNEDVSKGKPDPEMYNLAINKLGCTPKECLIIEDNENGLKAAYASGANVLKVETVDDVNYENIISTIRRFEKGDA